MEMTMERVKPFVYPLMSTVTLYLAFGSATHNSVIDLALSLVSLDFLLQLIIGMVLFSMSRSELLFPLVQVVIMSFFYLISVIKIKLLSGLPFGPYDIAGGIALFRILDVKEQLFAIGTATALLGLIVYNLKFDRIRIAGLLFGALLTTYAFSTYAGDINRWLDSRYTPQIWNKGHNFYTEGGTVYFIHEMARMKSEQNSPPDEYQVKSSLNEVGKIVDMPRVRIPDNAQHRLVGIGRNLHLIVVESLIDPLATLGVPMDKDPFYPAFRKRYAEGGNSVSLSPVYTGGTANAEFEILCGFPIYDGKIVFEHELENKSIPCLPGQLAQQGYLTVASHPNSKTYWNRDYAYPRLGFNKYYHIGDFEADDLNGSNLSDESLYRQNMATLKSEKGPIFNYLLTISNHYPYRLNEKRPTISVGSRNELVGAYLNAIYYSTKELYDHLERIRQHDNNALIVVVGDHSPYFGYGRKSGYDMYDTVKKGGSLSADELLRLTATPLLIINGRNGPFSVGTVAHYEIPVIIKQLLGSEAFNGNIMPVVRHKHLRPLPGYPLLYWDDSGYLICHEKVKDERCGRARSWQHEVEVMRRDLLFGGQYQLAAH